MIAGASHTSAATYKYEIGSQRNKSPEFPESDPISDPSGTYESRSSGRGRAPPSCRGATQNTPDQFETFPVLSPYEDQSTAEQRETRGGSSSNVPQKPYTRRTINKRINVSTMQTGIFGSSRTMLALFYNF